METDIKIPDELTDAFPRKGINFKELSFLISKNIYGIQECKNQSFSDFRTTGIDKATQQLLHDEYSKQLKKLKMLLRAFDIERYFIQNPTVGKPYALSKLEALYYFKIFYKMEQYPDVWSRIRNVKNQTYQGFIEIYYKCSDKKTFLSELDFFISETVKLYYNKVKKQSNRQNCNNLLSAREITAPMEEHLLFVTSRTTIDILEKTTLVQFNPNPENQYISIGRWIDYRRYIRKLYYQCGSTMDALNNEFLSKHDKSKNKTGYKLVIDRFMDYLKYQKKYIETISAICTSTESPATPQEESDNRGDNSRNDNKNDQLDKWVKKAFWAQEANAENEINNSLKKLLNILKEMKPNEYSKVIFEDILNPYVSKKATSNVILPMTFPTDIMVALLELEKPERDLVNMHYSDFPYK